MTTKTILFGSFAAVTVAALLIVGPAFGVVPPITGFSTPQLDEDSSELKGKKNPNKVEFALDSTDPVPRHGEIFGGYGVLTDGTLLVATSHAGFYDSEAQTPPVPQDDIIASPFAEVCLSASGSECGPEWHTHLVDLVPEYSLCESGLQVAALTYEQPSEIDVQAKRILLSHIQKKGTFTESVSGTVADFELGKATGQLVSFDLVPMGAPLPVCVENINAITP